MCHEPCDAIRQQCPDEWAIVIDYFIRAGPLVELEGLQFIDCDFPGEHLAPFLYCCSNIGFNISTHTCKYPKRVLLHDIIVYCILEWKEDSMKFLCVVKKS